MMSVGRVGIGNVRLGSAQLVSLGRPRFSHKSPAFLGVLEARIQNTFCPPLLGHEKPECCSALTWPYSVRSPLLGHEKPGCCSALTWPYSVRSPLLGHEKPGCCSALTWPYSVRSPLLGHEKPGCCSALTWPYSVRSPLLGREKPGCCSAPAWPCNVSSLQRKDRHLFVVLETSTQTTVSRKLRSTFDFCTLSAHKALCHFQTRNYV